MYCAVIGSHSYAHLVMTRNLTQLAEACSLIQRGYKGRSRMKNVALLFVSARY